MSGYCLRLTLLACCAVVLACSNAMADSYPNPNKPVTIIVPYPAGGPGDTLVRAVADALAAQLKSTFIVENRPGASQIVAARAAAQAAPDGHTLMLANTTNMILNPVLKKALPYDPVRDFEPISLVINSPQYLVTRPDFPANSIAELIDMARKSPGKITYASIGPGSTANIAGEVLNVLKGISIRNIPYPGAAPALRDVVAGYVDMFYTTSVIHLIKSGQVKALGMTGAKRSHLSPKIPALAESNMPDFDMGVWWGFVATKGTPKAAIDLLADGIKKAVETGALQKRLGASGTEFELQATTPNEFGSFMQSERSRWEKLIEISGIVGK